MKIHPPLDDYQKIIALSRYSRWDEEKGGRETWPETVDRALGWLIDHVNKLSDKRVSPGLRKELRDSMVRMDVLPSMRLLQYAGPAMDKNVARMFNCTAMRFDNIRAFDETVFLSMSGCGVGGRITKDNVDRLPDVPDTLENVSETYVVDDSLEGWATAVRLHMDHLYKGEIMEFDTSEVRAKGTRLVTSGGFAPGPELLEELLQRITDIFLKATGRKLWTIEVYKIFTKIAGVVVAGGSRRSALITLFSPNDREMTESKKGDWWTSNPSYAYSNNSASFWGQPDMKTFFEFWRDLYHSGSGEPAFVNGLAAKNQSDKFDRDVVSNQLLLNPCAEIYSFETTFLCNLTGVNIRPEDDLKMLKDKVRLASILGYWQATVTDFNYLRDEWRENAEKEMLLGVSLSGICDHPVLNQPTAKSAELLQIMRSHSKNTADRWANKLGKKKTVSWTTVKPSGNSAQLSGVSSGIHPAYARYYIRRIQQNTDDPLTKFLIDQGVPHEVSKYAANTTVFAFPRKAPETALLASDMTAIEQLELWLHYKRNYTTHTVSMTCYVDRHEWMEVGAWSYKHFEELIGVSFLPKNDHTYEQAPYEAITEEQYDTLLGAMPEMDWEQFKENSDHTSLTDKAECTGAACDVSFG